MATVATLVADTERHLLGGDRDELNRLSGSIGTTDTVVPLTTSVGGVGAGSYLCVDLEMMYVWSIDDAATTATVERAMLGTTAATHASGALVQVNPLFSKYDIFDALNSELSSLCTPAEGLFAVRSFTLETDNVTQSFTVPEDITILDILDVRYSYPGPELAWINVDRRSRQLMRDLPTTDFASGMALRIEQPMYPGRELQVRYSAPFTPFAALTDDPEVDNGLAASMLDIPSLGAAARLVGMREVKRSLTERMVDSRRAGEVTGGSSARAAAVLGQMRDRRVRNEAARLRQAWPG